MNVYCSFIYENKKLKIAQENGERGCGMIIQGIIISNKNQQITDTSHKHYAD